MNEGHLLLLRSSDWRHYLEHEVLPWIIDHADLTGEVLEIGPGPGLLTDLLIERTCHLVAVEVDADLAASLAQRVASPDVEILCADATRTSLPSGRFKAAIACTMLHHVPTPARQDELFAEAWRLLLPGGRFLAVDSLDAPELRAAHVDDTFVPVELSTLGPRLEAAGFTDVVVEPWEASTRSGPKVRVVAIKSDSTT